MLLEHSLKKIRTSLGLSQTKFARKFGRSQSLIAFYELGKRVPRYDDLKKYQLLAKKHAVNVKLL